MTRIRPADRDLLEVIGCDITLRPEAPGIHDFAALGATWRERSGETIRVGFPLSAAADLQAFVEAERVCCAGISWDVVVERQAVLVVTGSMAAMEAIEHAMNGINIEKHQ
jgi:hypothetical protein